MRERCSRVGSRRSGTTRSTIASPFFVQYRLEVNFELISRLTNVSVEPATLASIFEGRTVTVSLDQDWEPEEN